jgi:glycosyl transferase family 25
MGNSPYQVQQAVNGNSVYTVYINLAHRTDRRAEIEGELQRMGITQFERLDAIKNNHGSLGCSLSHIAALKQGIASGAAHIAIFEDDFQFLISPQEYALLLQALCSVDYDVVLLDPLFSNFHIKDTTHPLFRRNTKSCNLGGYIVNQKYASTLLENYLLSAELLRVFPSSHFCVDVFKNMLQRRDRWFTYCKKSGRQRASYSDIEKKHRDRE